MSEPGTAVWRSLIDAATAGTGVDPILIEAIMAVESAGVNLPANQAGAVGLMQIVPSIWPESLLAAARMVGNPESDPKKLVTIPEVNVRAAVRILQFLRSQHGDWDTAVRAYHGFGSDGISTDREYLGWVLIAKARIAAERGGSMPTPIVYDLRTNADAARFGLSPAERDAILTKRFPNRNGGQPRAIVVHIQDGNTKGSLRYWLGRDASATVMIQRDGSILRVIPEEHGPWTNGDVKSPTPASAKLRNLGGNPNIWSLTIENEGAAGTLFSEAQFAANKWQIEEWQARYGIPDDQVIRHADINSIDKARCPGDNNYQRIKADIAAGTPPPVPVDPLPYAALFGEVTGSDGTVYRYDPSPQGTISKQWRESGQSSGRYPPLVAVVTHNGSRVFQFGDGMIRRAPVG